MTVSIEHQEVLTDFASNVCDTYYEEFEPYASDSSTQASAEDRFRPPASAFGAHVDNFYYTSNPANLSFEYKPMTPEEYQKYGGADLSGWDDTGGPMNGWERTGNFFSYLSPVSWVELGFGSHHSQNPWYDYYEAIAGVENPKSYPPPTDDAPWAAELKQDWDSCVFNRQYEVDSIRGELKYLILCLVDAAEEYADTDLTNAVNIEKYDQDGGC